MLALFSSPVHGALYARNRFAWASVLAASLLQLQSCSSSDFTVFRHVRHAVCVRHEHSGSGTSVPMENPALRRAPLRRSALEQKNRGPFNPWSITYVGGRLHQAAS